MAITTYTLTADLNKIAGSDDYRIVSAHLTTNQPADVPIVDKSGKTIRLPGPRKLVVDVDGTITETVIASNSPDINITDGTLRYQVTVEYQTTVRQHVVKPRTWTSPWFSVTAATDLADKLEDEYLPPTVASAAIEQVNAAVAQAEAARDAAVDISNIDTSDGLVSTLVADPGSATGAALSEATAAVAVTPVAVAAEPSGGDDRAALQALLDLPGRGAVRLRTGATYKINGGLIVNPAKRTLIGDATVIDASGMTSGSAILLRGGDSGYDSSVYTLRGIELVGPGKDSDVIGLAIEGAGPGGQNTQQMNIGDLVIHEFAAGIFEGQYQWCNNVYGCHIYNCAIGVDYSAEHPNSGERMTYIGCTIGRCDLAIRATTVSGEHYFLACSIDYCGQQIQLTGPHRIVLIACHIEYDSSPITPVVLSGTNPVVDMQGGVWVGHTPTALTAPLTAGVAVTTLSVLNTSVAIEIGDTVVVSDGAGKRDTFTASAAAPMYSTSISVTSKAPTNSWVVGDKVINATALPEYVVTGPLTPTPGRGLLMSRVNITGISTSSGSFAPGGTSSQNCWVAPVLIDGTCINPNNGSRINMPADLPRGTSVQGQIHQQANNPGISSAGTTNLDPTQGALIELNVTTTSNFALSFSAAPPGGRTADLMLVVRNNSGAAMGAITWPGAITFAGKVWANPAAGMRRHLTARYNPTLGKWTVTDVASADY